MLVQAEIKRNPDAVDWTIADHVKYVNSVLIPELGLTADRGGDYRYMSVGVYASARKELCESGEIHVAKLPEIYMLNWQIRSTPPVYAPRPGDGRGTA